MDAADQARSWSVARLLWWGLMLSALGIVASVLLGADRAYAAEPEESSPGIVTSLVGGLGDVVTPVVTGVADTTAAVVEAVAPVVAPVTAPVEKLLVPAAPAPTPAASPSVPIEPPATTLPATSPAPHAGHAPAATPADTAVTQTPTVAPDPLSRLSAPILQLAGALPVAGPLLEALGVLHTVEQTTAALDDLIHRVDDALQVTEVAVPLPDVLTPVLTGASTPATSAMMATSVLAVATAVNVGDDTVTSVRGSSALTAAEADMVIPEADVGDSPPASAPPLLAHTPPAAFVGGSSGAALWLAPAAPLILVAHRAWVRRSVPEDDNAPAGPVLRSVPSPD